MRAARVSAQRECAAQIVTSASRTRSRCRLRDPDRGKALAASVRLPTIASRVALELVGDGSDDPSVRGAPEDCGCDVVGFIGHFPDGKVVDDVHFDGAGG